MSYEIHLHNILYFIYVSIYSSQYSNDYIQWEQKIFYSNNSTVTLVSIYLIVW